MSRTVYLPPFFRGDGMESDICIVDIEEVSGFMVLRETITLHLTIEGQKYAVYHPRLIVKPVLWLLSSQNITSVRVAQSHGKPTVVKAPSIETMTAPLYALVSNLDTTYPSEFISLVFTKEPNSLSGYGWRVTRHENNPLTPEWVANLETYQ